jgi:hypothetical protein
VFYIGDEPSDFTFDYFWSENVDPLLLMYNSTLADGSDLPDCVVFNNSTRTYTVSPDKEEIYSVAIDITHVYYPAFTKTYTWSLNITVSPDEQDYYVLNTGPQIDLRYDEIN